MAETPKNNIEKLLSDYAEQRRKAAGTPELHPATRQMLQSEVKRQFPRAGQTNTQPARSRWSLLWPRIAAACGVVAVAGVVVVLINPPGKSSATMEMALMEKAPSPTAPPAALAPTATPAPTRATRASDDRSGGMAGANLKRSFKGEAAGGEMDVAVASDSANELVAFGATRLSSTEVEARREATGGIASVGGTSAASGSHAISGGVAEASANESTDSSSAALVDAPHAIMTKAGVRSDSVATSSRMAKSAASSQITGTDQFLNYSSTQRYRNLTVVKSPKPVAAPGVLDEFTVEQNGRELKIVDRDGSVYNGFVQAAPVESATNNWAYGTAPGDDLTKDYDPLAEAAFLDKEKALPVEVQAAQAPQQQSSNEAENYYFRVEGTNRSLQQRVVVTGNIGNAFQNTIVVSGQNSFGNAQRFRQQNQLQAPVGLDGLNQQLQNNFINGRVILGDGKISTELNALPVDQ